MSSDDDDVTWHMAREKAAELLTENGAWLSHEQVRARVVAEVQKLMVSNINLALDAIGNQKEGVVRARRWKELAKKKWRVARMLGRRCDIVDERMRKAERKLELVRCWARGYVMTIEQRAAFKRALDGHELEERVR